MSRRLVVYMTPWCPDCRDVQGALRAWGVSFVTVNIREDRSAAARVRGWTGFESVPTLVIADEEGNEPFEPPAPLPPGRGPAGVDRGSLLTEPKRDQLRAWLVKNGLLAG